MKPAALTIATAPFKARAPEGRERGMNGGVFSDVLGDQGGKPENKDAARPAARQRPDALASRIAEMLDRKQPASNAFPAAGATVLTEPDAISEPAPVRIADAESNDERQIDPESVAAPMHIELRSEDRIVAKSEPAEPPVSKNAEVQPRDEIKSRTDAPSASPRTVQDSASQPRPAASVTHPEIVVAALSDSAPLAQVVDDQPTSAIQAAIIRPTDKFTAVISDLQIQHGSTAKRELAAETPIVQRIIADMPDAPVPRVSVGAGEAAQRMVVQTPMLPSPVMAVAASSKPKGVDASRELAPSPGRTIMAAAATDDPKRATDVPATVSSGPTAAAAPLLEADVPVSRTAPPNRSPAPETVRNLVHVDTPDLEDRAEPRDDGPPRAVDATSRTTLAASTTPPVATTPATTVVTAIVNDHSVRQLARAIEVKSLQSNGASTHSLKIQLHPAELGMVTATLRMAGDQMSVELTTDRMDAYERLSIESDTIVKSLRALGLQVDQVTVQPPQVTASPSARTDADGQMQSSAGREQQYTQAGQSSAGDTGGRSGGRSGGGNGNGDASATEASAVRENRDGRGLFI